MFEGLDSLVRSLGPEKLLLGYVQALVLLVLTSITWFWEGHFPASGFNPFGWLKVLRIREPKANPEAIERGEKKGKSKVSSKKAKK